ncbi:MAG TPA: hypothetical protein VK281_08065 [Xanthobacteraceae bacterium]|nr:hypothetical protein [Xanthobacteraceae bacterium]
MRIFRQATAGLLMLLGGTLMPAPASAIDLTGAWATDAAQCANVFKKKGKQLVFSELSDLHGSGFVIEDSRISGKSARCTIKSRTEDGATLNLLAACATDIMLSSVQFSLKVLNDNSISRIFPGMPGMEVTYYRCSF